MRTLRQGLCAIDLKQALEILEECEAALRTVPHQKTEIGGNTTRIYLRIKGFLENFPVEEQ